MNGIARLVSAAVLACAATLFAETVLAQSAGTPLRGQAAEDGESTTPDLKLAEVEAALAAIEADSGIQDSVKSVLRSKYKQAIDVLEEAAGFAAKAADYRESLKTASSQAADLRTRLKALPPAESAAKVTATYVNVVPEKNDGKTAYTLTAKDVPVDAFWSVTLYADEGWIPINKYKAYSFNNVTAKKAEDGSITIHFGGDPKADNFLPIVPGWNYIVRMYKPGREILNGSWKFPEPEAVR